MAGAVEHLKIVQVPNLVRAMDKLKERLKSAVIVLAIYSVRAVGGIDALKAGLAAHFGLDVVFVRIAFVLLTIVTGVSLLVWLALWWDQSQSISSFIRPMWLDRTHLHE